MEQVRWRLEARPVRMERASKSGAIVAGGLKCRRHRAASARVVEMWARDDIQKSLVVWVEMMEAWHPGARARRGAALLLPLSCPLPSPPIIVVYIGGLNLHYNCHRIVLALLQQQVAVAKRLLIYAGK